MIIIQPKVEILTPINGKEILEHIERCGRVSYKSEGNIKEGSAEKFVGALVRRGHESVLEHFNITVKFTTDRGISHELVRHRLASFTQESTRFICYANEKFGGTISVVKPSGIDDETKEYYWETAMNCAEKYYFNLIESGCRPEVARAVLPTCTKTELVMTANLREWRHLLKLRTAKDAHPDIRLLCIDLLNQLKEKIPVVFDDIEAED